MSKPSDLTDAQRRVIRALGEACIGSEKWQVAGGTTSRASNLPGCYVGYHFTRDEPAGPGTFGLSGELDAWGTVIKLRPDTSSMSVEQSAFWAALSDRALTAADPEPRGFDGFRIEAAELMPLLSESARSAMIEALRFRAAHRERRAFEQGADADGLRALIGSQDKAYACPVKVAATEFASEDGRLTVRRNPQAIDDLSLFVPAGAWVIVERPWAGHERLSGGYPRWWPSRRAADDEARRLLGTRNS